MIPIPFRGTGIFVLVYPALCMWLIGYFFDERTFEDPQFTAWVFLVAMIATSLHASGILIAHKRTGHGAQRRSIWHDTLLFIPVLIWPFIYLAIALYCFIFR